MIRLDKLRSGCVSVKKNWTPYKLLIFPSTFPEYLAVFHVIKAKVYGDWTQAIKMLEQKFSVIRAKGADVDGASVAKDGIDSVGPWILGRLLLSWVSIRRRRSLFIHRQGGIKIGAVLAKS